MPERYCAGETHCERQRWQYRQVEDENEDEDDSEGIDNGSVSG